MKSATTAAIASANAPVARREHRQLALARSTAAPARGDGVRGRDRARRQRTQHGHELRGGGDGIRGQRARGPLQRRGYERRKLARIDRKAMLEVRDRERAGVRLEGEPQLAALEHRR